MIPLAVTLCVIALILFLPVSLVVDFDSEFRFFVRVMCFDIRLSKRDKKTEKKEKPKSGKKKKTDSGTFLSKLETLKSTVSAACRHMHILLVIKRIDADITVATGDPCTTALSYGGVNAAVYSLISLFECGFRIKRKNINITADYNAEKTSVYFEAVLTTFLLRLIIFLILFISDGTIKLMNEKEK